MSKFKFKFKLTGLEVEIEGTRDDIPLMTQAIGQQVAGMLQPMNEVVDGEVKVVDTRTPLALSTQSSDESKKKRKRRSVSHKESTNSSGTSSPQIDNTIEFDLDQKAYGYPSQAWNTTNKCIWLMYVLGNKGYGTEFTARQLADTFNKYFKDAKMVEVSNINRDLGREKARDNAKVSSDTKKDPTTWFLTQKGLEAVQKTVADITKNN